MLRFGDFGRGKVVGSDVFCEGAIDASGDVYLEDGGRAT